MAEHNGVFKCPRCQGNMNQVVDSRKKHALRVDRRRECKTCQYRYSTVEVPVERFNALIKLEHQAEQTPGRK